ncbi:hypothetical protein Tco_0851964 [Tanacetum coccineum]
MVSNYSLGRYGYCQLGNLTAGKVRGGGGNEYPWVPLNGDSGYPIGFWFDLIAFSDDDHAGLHCTWKATSGRIQFLGDKLASWMSKRNKMHAMSSQEAEVCGDICKLCSSNVDEEHFKIMA